MIWSGMLHSLPTAEKLFYCVYYSLLELLGDEKADEIFSSAGLDPFDINAPKYFRHGSELLIMIASELRNYFGEETTRGLLIRMGSASLTFFRKYFTNIAQLGNIENRLKPLDRRFLSSLNTLAESLSEELGLPINCSAKDARNFEWQYPKPSSDLPAPALIPFFYFGLLEEFCTWLDARKNYLLNYAVDDNQRAMDIISIEIRDLD